jgi:hypothetical protein
VPCAGVLQANAAIARSFTAYFATLINKPPDFFVIPYGEYTVDFMAAGLVIVLCVILCFTTAGGSWFNIGEHTQQPR